MTRPDQYEVAKRKLIAGKSQQSQPYICVSPVLTVFCSWVGISNTFFPAVFTIFNFKLSVEISSTCPDCRRQPAAGSIPRRAQLVLPSSLALMQQEGPQPTVTVWSCLGAMGKHGAALRPLQPQHCADKAPVLLESHSDGVAQERGCSTVPTIHLLLMSHRTFSFVSRIYWCNNGWSIFEN